MGQRRNAPLENRLGEAIESDPRGLSLRQLAEMLGIDKNVLSRAARGERELEGADMVRLARYFGQTIEQLFFSRVSPDITKGVPQPPPLLYSGPVVSRPPELGPDDAKERPKRSRTPAGAGAGTG